MSWMAKVPDSIKTKNQKFTRERREVFGVKKDTCCVIRKKSKPRSCLECIYRLCFIYSFLFDNTDFICTDIKISFDIVGMYYVMYIL